MMRLLVLALVAACGGAPACPVTVKSVESPRPFLWKVQNGSGPIVWLYGTIHNGGEADVPKPAWDAFASSPRFVSELGDTEGDRDKTIDLVRLPSGKGLDQLLPADDWYDLRDALRGSVKEDDLKRVRPWYAMVRLNATVAPPPSPTMDFALAKRARTRGIPVDALESWEVQLAALADTVTVGDLQQALHARKTMRCELAELLDLYRTGDLPAMQARVLIAQTEKLIVERTKAWLPKIEPHLATDGAFVAVGLGHLAGDQGLPALLARAGYTVTRM